MQVLASFALPPSFGTFGAPIAAAPVAPVATFEAPAPVAPAPAPAPTPAMSPGLLSSRAMLRGASVSQFDGRKFDASASDELLRSKNAAADGGRFNKSLVPQESLAGVRAAATRIRSIHKRYTLPWSDKGLDILPSANVAAYDSDMTIARRDFESAVESFLAVYPSLVPSAAARLGGLYCEADYPTVEELRSRFGLRIRTLPMPDSRDFRVEMSEAQSRMIRAELEEESRQVLESAMRAAWQRVVEVVEPMLDKMKTYQPSTGKGDREKNGFHDSLVEHVRELVALLPSFNLTNDATLASVGARMERELCRHNGSALKQDATLRSDTAKAAEDILASVSAFLA